MIGIIDYDYHKHGKGVAIPSLVAMKLNAYLKKEKKPCKLLGSDSQIEACDEVYFFTDRKLEEIPPKIFTYPNVIFCGQYFSDPLPKVVHHMRPDISLYHESIQQKLVNGTVNVSKSLAMLDSTYYQAKINGERLPLPPMEKRKRFYLYDEDFLAYDDCWKILDEIIAKQPTTIYMVRPILCHTISQFFLLREEYEKVSRGNKIFLDYFVPIHQLEAYFGKYKMKLLGEITSNSDIRIFLGKNYGNNAYNNVFYTHNLFYCLNLLFSYYSRNIMVGADIWYIPENNNPYLELYKGIKSWANNQDKEITLRDSIKLIKGKEQLASICEKCPTFEQFLDWSKKKLIERRGIWNII